MAHFAEIDENNIVLRVLVVNDKDTKNEDGDEVESIGAKYLNDGFGGTWKKTSYNHNIRGRYAGVGYTYDATKDVFIAPKPYPSWRLDSNNEWLPPVGKEQPTPDWENDKVYLVRNWNDAKQKWEL